jgi:hypothetical protein
MSPPEKQYGKVPGLVIEEFIDGDANTVQYKHIKDLRGGKA